MTDERKDIWNDSDGGEEESAGQRRGFWSFFLALAIVLGVVALAAYRDGTGFDMLRRYLNYGKAEDAGGEILYDYDASSKNRFAVLGETLVVLSDTSLRVLNKDGGEVWSTAVSMTAPALTSGGGRAAAYDVGGTALYVLDASGLLMEITADEKEPLISASLNGDGWLAVTSDKKGAKGLVSVYNRSLELVFGFNSSRRFVLDGYVLDGRLAAVTLGQENGVFVSNVVLYDLSSEDPVADYDISGGLVAAIGEQDGKIAAVSDTCLTFAGINGQISASYSYGGAYLREYDLGGDGFVTLLLNRYRSGSLGRLVTVDTEGRELGSLEIREEIMDISAAGRYLAVLYADRLEIYNQDLQSYATLRGTETVRETLVRSDGSALLLSTESAGLFLP